MAAYAVREVNVFECAPLVDRGHDLEELKRRARERIAVASDDVSSYVILGGRFGDREVARIARASQAGEGR